MVRAAQEDLRNALATNARLHRPAKALDYVAAHLNKRGVLVTERSKSAQCAGGS